VGLLRVHRKWWVNNSPGLKVSLRGVLAGIDLRAFNDSRNNFFPALFQPSIPLAEMRKPQI
jgi:hypothetical protein